MCLSEDSVEEVLEETEDFHVEQMSEEIVCSENMTSNGFANTYSTESPKTSIIRTSPPPTASKKSPQVLLLEEFLASPADAKNPFEASMSEQDSVSSRKTSKALFKDLLNHSMESVDLHSPATKVASIETQLSMSSPSSTPLQKEEYFGFMGEASPVNSSVASITSCACCGNGKMAALEEMVDSLLREKLSQAEEIEHKELCYSMRLKQAAEREKELEEELAKQSDAFSAVMEAANQDAETIEALQLQ